MDNRLTLGTVHVVEWLRPGDRKTGAELLVELERLGKASKPEVQVRFWSVAKRDEFVGLFAKFEDEFRNTGRIPLLQIETHGDTNGIGVSANERINWPELMELFISLNRLTHLNLVTILAACEGFWGVQMLQPARKAAAFRGLIGPNREMSEDSMVRACVAFYRTAIGQLDGDAALKAMNDAVDTTRETFWVISAETAFKVVFRHFLETLCTPQAVEQRLDKIMTNVVARRRAKGYSELSAAEDARLRELTRQQLCDHRRRFEHMRRDFFYIDLYPENDQRFAITFEDVDPN